jgi:ankyrin repeat protein
MQGEPIKILEADPQSQWVEAYQEWGQAWGQAWSENDWRCPTPQQGLESSVELENVSGIIRALDLGARIDAPTSKEDPSILAMAIRLRSRQAALFLASRCDVNLPDPQGRSPLIRALERGLPDVARALAERGADLAAVASNGDTIAHAACRAWVWAEEEPRRGSWGSLEERLACIELAKAWQADWSPLNHDYEAPLELAAMRGAPVEELELIAPKNEVVHWVDGDSALALAVEKKHLNTARWLLGQGRFGLQISDNDGLDALMLAAKSGQEKMVELLLIALGDAARLEHGARRMCDNKRDALDYALAGGHWMCVAAFVRAGWLDSDPERAASRAASAARFNKARCLEELARGMDLRLARGVDNQRLVAVAAAERAGQATLWLSQFDPESCEARDANGRHPLLAAAIGGDSVCVKAILEAIPAAARAERARQTAFEGLEARGESSGQSWLNTLSEYFDVGTAKNQHGQTLLMVAARVSAHPPVEFLMSRVDANLTDLRGRSALWFACMQSFSSRPHDLVLATLMVAGGHDCADNGVGRTPLIVFVSHCSDTESFKRFLPDLARAGDPLARSRAGMSALETLRSRHLNDSIFGMLEHGEAILGAEEERRHMMACSLPSPVRRRVGAL